MASGLDTTTTTTTSSTKENFVQDIPLPRCLVRHITNPSYCLSNATSLGKITGYRIEVTGRRGTRSSKQTVSHGKIDNPDIGASYADFARSWYVHKKGVSGVKVWVGYSK
jgi:ribosomal protein S3